MTAGLYRDTDFVEAYAATNENYPKLAARLKEMVGGQEGEYGLDLGCGHGRDTRLMAEFGCKAIGMDYSQTMIKKAVQLGKVANIYADYVVGDMRNVGEMFAEDTFAIVWCTASLIHIPVEETGEVLAGLWKVAKPGALVYVGLKGGKTGTRMVTETKYGREIVREFSFWEEADFFQLAEENGFEVIDCDVEVSGKTGGEPTEWLNFTLKKASR